MIDPGHPRLSIVCQCELASISRSSSGRRPGNGNDKWEQLAYARVLGLERAVNVATRRIRARRIRVGLDGKSDDQKH